MAHIDNLLLTERYRPKTLDEIILPERIKKRFSNGLNNNILCFGPPGTGKSSLAKMVVRHFEHPYIYINCSKDSSVEILREEITDFCALKSMKSIGRNNSKVVILDELDGSSQQFYKALRASMEEYKHVRFIATCNYINKIPEALQSRRFDLIDFSFTENDERDLKKDYVRRIVFICKNEKIEIDIPAIENLIKKYFPDMGSMLNLIQGFLTEGKSKITGEDIKKSHSLFQNLFKLIVDKSESDDIYKIILESYSSKIESVLSTFFWDFPKYIIAERPEYINLLPQYLKIIADYQSKRNQIIDTPLVPIAMMYEMKLITDNFKK
jgi:DNA polymerase III delta prime subunit